MFTIAQQTSADAATVIALVVVILLIFGTIAVIVSRYKMCPSDKILIVYGNVGTGRSAKCIHGGATFVFPIFQSYAYL